MEHFGCDSVAAQLQLLRLLADGKAVLRRQPGTVNGQEVEQWWVEVFPDRDFIFGYEEGGPSEPIGAGYMKSAQRAILAEAIARGEEWLIRAIFGGLAGDTATILAELPRLGVSLLTLDQRAAKHPTPPAQEGEEPAGTSLPVARE